MATPSGTPGEFYERALSGESDLYSVVTGGHEKNGWGAGIPLFFVETLPGIGPDETEVLPKMELYHDCDPQGPYKLTHEQLLGRLSSYQAAIAEDERQRTDEMDALMGVDKAA